ncbi:MAG TPA: lanthionine synthetase LanC family protein [Solirubrobacteraceae bacterium]|nr:lanthionine synthetase LanC family protein [Solirubrobacteraceae bacterium]
MSVLDRFVLPPDVTIAPVAELPEGVRDQVDGTEGECAVTRPRTRAQSSIVDARTAALLETFREPTSIVDAVIAFSATAGVDPRETLDDAFAVLRGFVADGVLVEADSALAEPITTSLAPGDRIGAFDVLEPLHVIDDTEIHLGRSDDGELAALKVARPGAGHWLPAALAREASVLGRLDGRVTPRLLQSGEVDGRPFVAMSWCDGVDVHHAAAEARALGGVAGRTVLLALAERLVEAYAHLHERGVLHGDVHPRNAIACPDGSVVLIDFGLAADMRAAGGPARVPRGGVDLFLDPETARARLSGAGHVELTAAAEQYSLGALLYLLLTGAHTRAFSLEQEEMLRQLAEEPPLPFARHGVDDLPAVERTVARALADDPNARWGSTGELLRALRAAAAQDRARARPPVQPPSPGAPASRLLDDVLARLTVPGELSDGGLDAPTASAMNGGAGFAYALLRLAALREDPALLAQADLWSTRSTLASGSHEAFFNAEIEIVPEVFGERSFYHHVAGVHAVQALVAHGRGDDGAGGLALRSFVAAAGRPCEHVDVAFGRAGLLLGCALMLEALPERFEDQALRETGDRIAGDLWRELARHPPLGERPALGALGAAHGWAGFLFALLRWSEASATPAPDGLDERLEQLAALALPAGRGLRWPADAATFGSAARTGLEASWCNGAAGYVELWLAAHRRSGEERFAQLAERAAWTAYEGGPDVCGDLCCGLAGRAYALLGLHRHSGEAAWLARARLLGARAATEVATHSLRRDSLYKGEVGVALLTAELADSEPPGMPLFAPEA